MTEYPLRFRDDHFFIELDGALWLLDTGAPSSFGTTGSIRLDDQSFEVDTAYMGLTADTLSELTGVPTEGLLGTDVLSEFDHLFDPDRERLTISRDELDHPGTAVPLDDFMGIPIVEAECGGRKFRLFFDTGAQVSYLQDDLLAAFPSAGTLRDFYPGFGDFETETHEVDFVVAGLPLSVRCGRLPGLLGASLAMAGVQGILGNPVMTGRKTGYFPRRNALHL